MLYHLFARLLVSVLAILLIAHLLPGISVSGLETALLVAVVMGVVNVTLKPILVLLTLPITILTLGLFIFVINALMLWFIAALIEGFTVASFGWALLGSVLISIVVWAGHRLLERD